MASSIKPNFFFLYNGAQASPEKIGESTATENDKTVTTSVFDLGGGVTITQTCTRYDDYDSVEWVNFFENKGDEPSGLISELRDCCTCLPFPKDPPRTWATIAPDFDKNLQFFVPKGGSCCYDDFSTPPADEFNFWAINLLLDGETQKFSPIGARSSNGKAPFIQLHRDNTGFIAAVGWTGQWEASVKRTDDYITLSSGIEETSFRILPGESFRTSSVVIMQYEGSRTDGCNRWRRLIKEHYSLIGKDGRDALPPFSIGLWGALKSDDVIRRLKIIDEAKIPFTHAWMDAGWYGDGGDWSVTAGDWRINTDLHPDKLLDVTKTAHDCGMKFLLWFEPERVVEGMPITKEHPEYFLRNEKMKDTLILKLGDPEVWQYCYDLLSEKITELNIDVYRQDFNVDILDFFRANDTEERRGITEILHINGMYRLWDRLLENFPHLVIDNCASGGRRIDIETLKRSIPLWRSDEYGFENYPEKIAQIHNATFGLYMPYSGDGTPYRFDTYSFRSAYAPALQVSQDFVKDTEHIDWLKKMTEEYVRVQPYLSCDIYPLTENSYNDDVWSAIQYNRPEEGDGVILAYRREKAAYDRAVYPLYGLEDGRLYTFTDEDSGVKVTFTGKELAENGLPIVVAEKRSSRVIFYTSEK